MNCMTVSITSAFESQEDPELAVGEECESGSQSESDKSGESTKSIVTYLFVNPQSFHFGK